MTIRFDGRVAIVTGAGGGLGRCHALALAARGAKVVVNDIGEAREGKADQSTAAERVAREICETGGEAIAYSTSVTDFAEVEAMAATTLARWGRVDILINNAGILRDKSFLKMELADFRAVLDVHLMGSVHCTKAVWEIMRRQQYGRIVMTTSSVGLFGNFGQANYAAAKMALVGLMQALGIEGAKHNIRVNCIAPTAATQMTEGLFSPDLVGHMRPEKISPAVLALVSEDAPSRAIIAGGAGSFERVFVTLTQGAFFEPSESMPELILANLSGISDRRDDLAPRSADDMVRQEMAKATRAHESGSRRGGESHA
jgi:NAD(P)-dependent dehydrogenase (short-subunit alcohol dehydrogenase family)